MNERAPQKRMSDLSQLSDKWCEGWKAACLKFKDAINEWQQKAGDPESQDCLSDLFVRVKNMEKDTLNEVPTIVAKHEPIDL